MVEWTSKRTRLPMDSDGVATSGLDDMCPAVSAKSSNNSGGKPLLLPVPVGICARINLAVDDCISEWNKSGASAKR